MNLCKDRRLVPHERAMDVDTLDWVLTIVPVRIDSGLALTTGFHHGPSTLELLKSLLVLSTLKENL